MLPREAIWVTSGMRRAVQTAEALTQRAGLAPQLRSERDLDEQGFGAWEGLTHDEVAMRFPEQAARFWRAPATEAPPGGESFAMLAARVAQAIGRLNRDGEGRDVVAIAHAGTIRAALMLALELDAARALSFAIDPLTLTRLDHLRGRENDESGGADGSWSVLAVNQGAVLRPL